MIVFPADGLPPVAVPARQAITARGDYHMFKPAIVVAFIAALVSLVACGGTDTDTAAADTATAE